MTEPTWLTPKAVADRLSVSPQKVYALIAQRRLRATRLGNRCLRVSSADVDRLVADNVTTDPAA